MDLAGAASIGAELDPSHLMWQGMDVIACIRWLGPLVFHAAAKDARIEPGVAIRGVLDTRFGTVPADAEGKTPTGIGYRCSKWPDDPAWRFVAIGVGHDVPYWTEFLRALAEVDPDLAVNIEHGDASYSRIDPAMYHASMSVADELRKAADLGYEYLKLSPRADWFFWHRYPKAGDAMVAEVNRAVKETGVRIASLVPVFGWSAPDEQERQVQVRNWKRLLEIADGLDCPVIMTELSGDPNQPLKSEHAFYHSMEELIPLFERYDLRLDIEAHPYDFSERNDDAVQIVRGLNRPWINCCFCVPHAFHLSDGAGDIRAMIPYAAGKLTCRRHRRGVRVRLGRRR